jgi:hypothetical protein
MNKQDKEFYPLCPNKGNENAETADIQNKESRSIPFSSPLLKGVSLSLSFLTIKSWKTDRTSHFLHRSITPAAPTTCSSSPCP